MAGSNYLVSRAHARDDRQADLRRSLTALLSALFQLDLELRTEPKPKGTVRVINEQMERRFPQIDYVTGRLHRRLFQPRLDQLLAQFTDAMSATLLAAPQELLTPLWAVSELMETVEPHDAAWREKWMDAHSELVVACRRTLGAEMPVGTPPPSVGTPQ